MKNRIAIALLLVGLLSAGTVNAEDKYYKIDPGHSGVGFRIRHLYSYVNGRFNDYSGYMWGDFEDPTTLQIMATVDVNSIDTAIAGRDVHLRNPDFLNVTKFPNATFRSTKVVVNKDGRSGKVIGNMTIRNITKSVTFVGEFLGRGVDHRGGQRAGFHAKALIKKADFGIPYNMKLGNGITVLGEEVELLLDIEAIEQDKKPAELAPKKLSDQISEYRDSNRREMPTDIKAVLEKAKAEIMSQADIEGLPIGSKAPNFNLPDAEGNKVKLSKELKKGPVVLVFYRGEWCPFCNLQLRALGESYQEIRKLGASLIGISPQTANSGADETTPLPFPLLSDASSKTLRKYKLLYQIPAEMQKVYRDKFHIDLDKYNGEGRWELPVTATYIVDQKGIIRSGLVDIDYTKRMEPEDIIKALKEL